MERIDLARYELPFALPLPKYMISMMTIFLPRVLRHLLPVLFGWLVAFEAAANLLYYLFDLPDHTSARKFLFRLRNPNRFGGDTVVVTPQTMEQQRGASMPMGLSGPGYFQIPAGHAAVTERNGRYYRTHNAGRRLLDNFEHIHTILDLRPQQRDKSDVWLQSREGLEVMTDVSVTFRISRGGAPATPDQPYPFDSLAARKLSYAQINLSDGRIGTWEDSALRTAIGILRKRVITFSLDELLEEPRTEIGAHLTISRQVQREAGEILLDQGIELERVRIGTFGFPDDVTHQHIAHWSAVLDSEAELANADRKPFTVEEMEAAHAKAEMKMGKEIAEAMQRAKQQGHDGPESDVVALRLVAALERVALQSQTDVALTDQMLLQLQALQQELST